MTFDSSQHPRGAGGKFAASGNSAYGTSGKTKEQAANFKTLPDDKKKPKGKRKKTKKSATKRKAASKATRKQGATSKQAARARAHRLAGSRSSTRRTTRKIRPLTSKQRKRLRAEAKKTKLTTVRKRRIKAAARTQRLGRGGGFLPGSTVTRTVRDTKRVRTAGAVRAQRRLAADLRLRRRGVRRYGR